MDPVALRAQFPVFERLAYLNAGTCGPLPAAAARAACEVLDAAAGGGRWQPYFERMLELQAHQRAAYAALLGAEAQDVALTTSTSEGIVRVLGALGLGAGDEVVTATDEHPGLLGPLAAAQQRLGIAVRSVALEDVRDAVGPATALVACSHVGWVSGQVAPDMTGLDVPVLFDGAQGVGAIPVDVGALGCAFYAGSGQKWLCGPVGTGMLWIAPEWSERLAPVAPTYMNLADPNAGLAAAPHPGARAYDSAALSLEAAAAAAAAFVVLAETGWTEVHHRGATLAEALAIALAERGYTVGPRGQTTLVAWEDPDPPATRARLAEERIVIRDLPNTPYLRASVGAWNDESDLERLLRAL